MADEPEKSPIQSKYAQQYADDLAANRKEQSDLTAQIAALQERLEQLRADEAWLTQAQSGLPRAAVPGRPVAAVAEALPVAEDEQPEAPAPAEDVTDAPRTVPQPRQDEPVKAQQPKQPARKAAAKKATAKKATAKKTTAKATARKASAAKKPAAAQAPAPEAAVAQAPAEKAAPEEKPGPPLWQLVLDILLKTPGQPCVAREVADLLAQEHPGRATSVQTVRNNLESLVKKGLAEKVHQQGSAMYTAYPDAGKGAEPETHEAAGGTEQSPEAAAEKVPAEV
ncbi:hypothetical protein SUDANB105_07973 [Streptomyces sp. enrichment culture]|uniref:hypothetical protein n=1 Tax=Streptomyces sp. enrichment culture TaxID=1795815 RepID=UPI003F54B53F